MEFFTNKPNWENWKLRWWDDKLGMTSGNGAMVQAHFSQDNCIDFLYWLLVKYSWTMEIPRVAISFGSDNQP